MAAHEAMNATEMETCTHFLTYFLILALTHCLQSADAKQRIQLHSYSAMYIGARQSLKMQ